MRMKNAHTIGKPNSTLDVTALRDRVITVMIDNAT